MLDRKQKKGRVHVLAKYEGQVYVADNKWLYSLKVGLWPHLNVWPSGKFLLGKDPIRKIGKKIFGSIKHDAKELDATQLDLFKDEHFLLFTVTVKNLSPEFFHNKHWHVAPRPGAAVTTRFEKAVVELLKQCESGYIPMRKQHGMMWTA